MSQFENKILPWMTEVSSVDAAAVEIATRRTFPMDHTATLLEERDSRIVYGPELPVGVFASEIRSLPFAVHNKLGMPRMHAWLFTGTTDLKGYTIHFAALPHTQNRQFSGVLKAAQHDSGAAIERALLRAIERAGDDPDPERRLQLALDSMTRVPFESRNTVVASWMVCPDRVDGLGADRFDARADYAVGISRDAARCREMLRIDDVVEPLFELTDSGKLFDDMPDSPAQHAGPVACRVADFVIDNKHMILDTAITLALAGPFKSDMYNDVPKEKRFVGRALKWIFRDIAFRWSRDGFEGSSGEYLPALRAQFEERGREATIPLLISQAEKTAPGDAVFLRVLLSLPDGWNLAPELAAFFEASLRRLRPESSLHKRIRNRLLTATR